MPGVLFFCTTEEARGASSLIKVLSINKDTEPSHIVESREGPTNLVAELKDGETFETDFISASIEDCGSWGHQQQEKNSMVEQDVIAIVDERSTKDQTIIMTVYLRDTDRSLLRKDQKTNVWYEFRVPFFKSNSIRSLMYGDADEEYGAYFWRKEELTDEYGISDVDRIKELYLQGEGRVPMEEGIEE